MPSLLSKVVSMMPRRHPSRCRGFTLVELLVVMCIIGVLVGLLLPAVQYAREAARRAECQNNLKQVGIALQNFHAARQSFPPGNDCSQWFEHSWVTYSLPYIEQSNVLGQYDFSRTWNDGTPTTGNAAITGTTLAILRCPSSVLNAPGDTDYGGNIGSSLSGLRLGDGPGQAWSSGLLTRTTPEHSSPIDLGSVRDGASNTILAAEVADMPEPMGRWASGSNCFAHENGPINSEVLNGIHSWHHGRAFVLMGDGSVQALTNDMDLYLLGAISTRHGGEVVRW